MLKYLYQNAWLLVLLLSSAALLTLVVRLWRKRRRGERLEADRSGLWRYHKDSSFRRKEAFGALLGDKAEKAGERGKAIALIRFKGDLRAKEHVTLGRLVDEIEVNRDKLSEVVVCLTSGGGMISQYGHAASQLERIRRLGLELTVCIDVVAASGGYLMSLPANKIIAAPYAIVGSIGVVAFVPNVRRFLVKRDIDPRTFTAGRFKRTVSLTDDAAPEDIARFQSQLDSIHEMFKHSVRQYRPSVDIEKASSGEHWTAAESLELGLGLVDELGTSEEYLLKKNRQTDLIEISQKLGFLEEGIGWLVSVLSARFQQSVPVSRLSF